MNKNLYFKLSINNIKKNKNVFMPFILSMLTMVGLFYMLSSVKSNCINSNDFYGRDSMMILLDMGIWVCGIFSVIVLIYTHSFLMKQRAKELGLYSILGMEKKHIAKVVLWENFQAGGISLTGGIVVGIAFNKLVYMIFTKMSRMDVEIDFAIPVNSIIITLMLFGGIIVFNGLTSIVVTGRLKPIDMLGSAHKGEKEPRAKWLGAILGIAFLGAGYYIAVTTDDILQALSYFFIAVIFVMAGTYLLFMSGSIAILKLMKKNKRFYYHRTHFITVSGMMYRMKRNAVGLANICILSTAVVVVLSTTVSLYMGIDNTLKVFYPNEVNTEYVIGSDEKDFDAELFKTTINEHAKSKNVKVVNGNESYSYEIFVKQDENGEFKEVKEHGLGNGTIMLMVTTRDSLGEKKARITGDIADGEAAVYITNDQVAGDTINVEGAIYKVRQLSSSQGERLLDETEEQFYLESNMTYIMIILKDNAAITDFAKGKELDYCYKFDVDGTENDSIDFSRTLKAALTERFEHVKEVSNIFDDRGDYISIYSTLLFIGVFIGAMFLMATVLIIYYKQISEGYEDRQKFEILQKVGMSRIEVKKVITTQILQVFFLPILLAIVHIIFAFPIVRKMMAMLMLKDTALFVLCTIGTLLVFIIVYAIVYYITAGSYYKIVYGKKQRA